MYDLYHKNQHSFPEKENGWKTTPFAAVHTYIVNLPIYKGNK